VNEGGEQRYLDVNVACRQACLNAIEYMKKFGYSAAQAYAILGTAPVQGHISGGVDIPNSCATLWLLTEIFDFDINPGANGPSGCIKRGVDMPLAPDLIAMPTYDCSCEVCGPFTPMAEFQLRTPEVGAAERRTPYRHGGPETCWLAADCVARLSHLADDGSDELVDHPDGLRLRRMKMPARCRATRFAFSRKRYSPRARPESDRSPPAKT